MKNQPKDKNIEKKKYELLAPAGDFSSLIAAIKSGADAVYFGLNEFNMRDSAKNFTLKDLPKIRKIAGDKKLYLTLNTIIYDKEIPKIEKILKLIKGKIDAVICWDFAVAMLCKKYKIPFHISTQASVANTNAAEFFKKIGAERIILARELNLKQIKNVIKQAKIPVEVFVHGAMCVSISGRCFTSQFLQGRSANRGQCAHPCRREYKITDEDGYELKLENNRVMSAKDLCTLPFIEKLKQAGITAFKIEGRNRPAEYVSIVTQVYRKALDKKLSKEEVKQSLEELKKVYNKGFSSGFYLGVPTSDDFSNSKTGEQTEKKVFLGNINHFWPNISVIAIKLVNSEIKFNDEIYIKDKKTHELFRTKIESLQIHHKSVEKAEKGEEVGIKISKNISPKENSEVYLIQKKSI
jgi:putative protease